MNFTKFLITPVSYRTPQVAASVPSVIILDKGKLFVWRRHLIYIFTWLFSLSSKLFESTLVAFPQALMTHFIVRGILHLQIYLFYVSSKFFYQDVFQITFEHSF